MKGRGGPHPSIQRPTHIHTHTCSPYSYLHLYIRTCAEIHTVHTYMHALTSTFIPAYVLTCRHRCMYRERWGLDVYKWSSMEKHPSRFDWVWQDRYRSLLFENAGGRDVWNEQAPRKINTWADKLGWLKDVPGRLASNGWSTMVNGYAPSAIQSHPSCHCCHQPLLSITSHSGWPSAIATISGYNYQ